MLCQGVRCFYFHALALGPTCLDAVAEHYQSSSCGFQCRKVCCTHCIESQAAAARSRVSSCVRGVRAAVCLFVCCGPGCGLPHNNAWGGTRRAPAPHLSPRRTLGLAAVFNQRMCTVGAARVYLSGARPRRVFGAAMRCWSTNVGDGVATGGWLPCLPNCRLLPKVEL